MEPSRGWGREGGKTPAPESVSPWEEPSERVQVPFPPASAAQTAVVLPSLNSNSPAIVEQARRVPGGAPPPTPYPDS